MSRRLLLRKSGGAPAGPARIMVGLYDGTGGSLGYLARLAYSDNGGTSWSTPFVASTAIEPIMQIVYSPALNMWAWVDAGNSLYTASNAAPSTFTHRMYGIQDVNWNSALGMFSAIGIGGGELWTSTDGITWTARAMILGGANAMSIVTLGAKNVVSSSANVGYSTNGTTYTTVTAMSADILGASPTMVVAPRSNTSYYSTDAISWTQCTGAHGANQETKGEIIWGTYGGGRWLVNPGMGYSGLDYSNDGIYWANTATPGLDDYSRNLGYSDGLFYGVGAEFTGYTAVVNKSTDGINWTPCTQPSTTMYIMCTAIGSTY